MLLIALLSALVIVAIYACSQRSRCGCSSGAGCAGHGLGAEGAAQLSSKQGGGLDPDTHLVAESACTTPPGETSGRLYSTADVDPMVTGQLYKHADNLRNIYAQRTGDAMGAGAVQGLVEYSSSGLPGGVGVDVGPYGLAEYGGQQIGFDDGIPENWALPTTPIRWYKPAQRDFYGPEGPTVYSDGLFTLTEPDHDELTS